MNLFSSEQITDFSTKRVMIPTSGGINSAAVICFLGEHFPAEYHPRRLFLYYSHLIEHSPDTSKFVKALVQYAKGRFEKVKFAFNYASANQFFIEQKMIPHPSISPCSRELKMRHLDAFYRANDCDVRLGGYIRTEMRRYVRAQKYNDSTFEYPILEFSEDDCFEIVKATIGWYPAIYDIRWATEHLALGLCKEKQLGKRVFLHNNCLPCKNMTAQQLKAVGHFYPEYAERAEETARQIPGAYWGRDDVPEVFRCVGGCND